MLQMDMFLNNTTADNRIVVNGMDIAMVSDDVAEFIINVAKTNKIPTTQRSSSATANYKPKWSLDKVKVGTKTVWRVSESGYSKCTEHRLANELIKALPNIKVGEMLKANSTDTFKIWYYTTEKDAKKYFATLPEVITADAIEARKATYKNKK